MGEQLQCCNMSRNQSLIRRDLIGITFRLDIVANGRVADGFLGGGRAGGARWASGSFLFVILFSRPLLLFVCLSFCFVFELLCMTFCCVVVIFYRSILFMDCGSALLCRFCSDFFC